MSAQKHLRDMAVLYPNFKINPSKLSGDLKINMGTLKVDSDVDPENWKVLDSATGNIIPVSAMSCKCAENFALKRAFSISGLVTQEEFGIEDNEIAGTVPIIDAEYMEVDA